MRSPLLKKHTSFTWTAAQEAFTKLERQLMSAPVLKLFSATLPTEVHTDASSIGIGGMLIQWIDGKPHIVYTISKRCTISESVYHYS